MSSSGKTNVGGLVTATMTQGLDWRVTYGTCKWNNARPPLAYDHEMKGGAIAARSNWSVQYLTISGFFPFEGHPSDPWLEREPKVASFRSIIAIPGLGRIGADKRGIEQGVGSGCSVAA